MLKIDYLKDHLFVDALHDDFLLFQKQKQKKIVFEENVQQKTSTHRMDKNYTWQLTFRPVFFIFPTGEVQGSNPSKGENYWFSIKRNYQFKFQL